MVYLPAVASPRPSMVETTLQPRVDDSSNPSHSIVQNSLLYFVIYRTLSLMSPSWILAHTLEAFNRADIKPAICMLTFWSSRIQAALSLSARVVLSDALPSAYASLKLIVR